MMTNEELKTAEEIANNATPGPWIAETKPDYFFDNYENPTTVKTGWIEKVVEYDECGSHEAKWKEGNLEFVTHFSPAFCLRLIEHIRNLQEQVKFGVDTFNIQREIINSAVEVIKFYRHNSDPYECGKRSLNWLKKYEGEK